MTPWDRAAAAIAAAFAEPQPVAYSPAAGGTLYVSAVRTDDPLADNGRRIVYEFRDVDLAADPTKQDRFVARGRRWRVINVPERANAAGGWALGVADDGAAP